MRKINKTRKIEKVCAPFIYFGGKGLLRTKIIPILEAINHKKYIEVFGGGASVLLGKKPTGLDVYNDIDSALYDFFNVISKEKLFMKFRRRIEAMPYSRQFHGEYKNGFMCEKDLIERVAQWFLFVNQSFSGDLKNGGWSYANKAQKNIADSCRSWMSRIDNLQRVHRRLQYVQIEKNDFRKIIKTYDNEDALFYLDPPYVSSQRTGGKYRHEISNMDHVDMIDLLLTLKGKSVVSGYVNLAYERLESAGFYRKDFKVHCTAAGRTTGTNLLGKCVCDERQERTESLWICPKSIKFLNAENI